jgi:hypothetical protein
MSKTYRIIAALVVIFIVGYGGWRLYQSRRAIKAGLLSENITHTGNDWTADFTAIIPAPEAAVFNAVRDVEKAQSDQIQNVRVISQTDNSKTVELEIKGPGDQTIKTQMAFDYDRAGHRISYHTVDTPEFVMHADYKFADQGGSTLITYHQTTTLEQQLPVPESVINDVIRSVFVAQLEGLKRTLKVATSEEPEDSSEEP